MGHPVLRTKAKSLDKATLASAVVQKLIDDMIETMDEYHGVGLAAPQVHEDVRLFVASLDMERGEEPTEPIAIINPEITPLDVDRHAADWTREQFQDLSPATRRRAGPMDISGGSRC